MTTTTYILEDQMRQVNKFWISNCECSMRIYNLFSTEVYAVRIHKDREVFISFLAK